ncbi:hypothetical protein GTO91_04110 [Heliobacterium undosum]|uniref:Uncharacterized protein n=1 Tax=Heliomicrobium undosum TaxID=121734 RepID=A0A845KZ13_9FIRM|nr:hypothetical protein [Heliomicrobium undosum]MZP28893.1 hypothetical protein [Heliomicrobium undosum]
MTSELRKKDGNIIDVDKNIYEKMQKFISRTEEILLLCQDLADTKLIQCKYKDLKYDIRLEARFWDKTTNNKVSNLVEAFFVPTIQETSAFGFEAPTNSNIKEIQRSLFEAEYKLTKYKSKQEWFEYR